MVSYHGLDPPGRHHNPLFQDCRYAVRGLRKNLGLTMVVVLSLGIGVGANSAIFSVVDALLLRPLPFPEADRLANIWLRSPATGINRDWLSQWQYARIRDENRSFDETAIARLIGWSLTGRDKPNGCSGCVVLRACWACSEHGRTLGGYCCRRMTDPERRRWRF